MHFCEVDRYTANKMAVRRGTAQRSIVSLRSALIQDPCSQISPSVKRNVKIEASTHPHHRWLLSNQTASDPAPQRKMSNSVCVCVCESRADPSERRRQNRQLSLKRLIIAGNHVEIMLSVLCLLGCEAARRCLPFLHLLTHFLLD